MVGFGVPLLYALYMEHQLNKEAIN